MGCRPPLREISAQPQQGPCGTPLTGGGAGHIDKKKPSRQPITRSVSDFKKPKEIGAVADFHKHQQSSPERAIPSREKTPRPPALHSRPGGSAKKRPDRFVPNSVYPSAFDKRARQLLGTIYFFFSLPARKGCDNRPARNRRPIRSFESQPPAAARFHFQRKGAANERSTTKYKKKKRVLKRLAIQGPGRKRWQFVASFKSRKGRRKYFGRSAGSRGLCCGATRRTFGLMAKCQTITA